MGRLLRGGLAGGALVLVTGTADEEDLAVYRNLSRDYLKTVVMAVAEKETEAILQLRRVGAIPVLAGPGAAWGPALA